MEHPCEVIYHADGTNKKFGSVEGVCVFLGRQAVGVPFNEWVSKTFTDYNCLKSGSIVSNEALFTLQNSSQYLADLLKKEKKQHFRTYSHVVVGNKWHMYTKANKREIFAALCNPNLKLAVISESGQKHLVFKHRLGLWQLEEQVIEPDVALLKSIHDVMCIMYASGFSQKEIITGRYDSKRVKKMGLRPFISLENKIKTHRGTGVFDIAAFLIYEKDGVKSFWEKKEPIVNVKLESPKRKQLDLWT